MNQWLTIEPVATNDYDAPAIVSAPLTRETFNELLSAGKDASATTYSEYVQRLAEAIENGSSPIEE